MKSLLTAVVVIASIELVEKIKKGQFKTVKLGGNAATMPEVWQPLWPRNAYIHFEASKGVRV